MGMSIHHHHSADSGQTPVVLPLAVITVNSYGILTVTMDGTQYPPPSPTTPWSKARFGDLLDTLTLDRTQTVRVEVHEADGSTFTDIIQAAHTPRALPHDETSDRHRRVRHRHTPDIIEVTAAEKARATLDLGEIPADRTDVILIGSTSAQVVVRRAS